MTDNDIIKALEICSSEADAGWCDICPYEGTVGSGCSYNLISDTIALINRQNEEIYKLEGSLIEEITRRENAVRAYHEARTEAIKEFAERLEEDAILPRYRLLRSEDVERDIDRLVCEMVGERE